MTTPRDIINLAFDDMGALGSGQTATGEDMNKAYTRLQWLLAQWQRKRWMIYHLVDLSVVSTGQLFYTIGPGGDINTPTRPDRLESAFLRQLVNGSPNAVDYPLELLQSMEDYTMIALKTLKSFSGYVFLDSDYPLGKVYPWPVPEASLYEVHVQVKAILNQFTSLDQEVNLPEEYLPALEYNLAVRLAPAYGQPVPQGIVGLAKDAMNVIRNSNTQIARLQMPSGLGRPGVYNPYSDQIR